MRVPMRALIVALVAAAIFCLVIGTLVTMAATQSAWVAIVSMSTVAWLVIWLADELWIACGRWARRDRTRR